MIKGEGQAKGLVVKGRMKENGSSNDKCQCRSKKGKCHYCHKPMHFRRDCLKLKENEKKVTSTIE